MSGTHDISFYCDDVEETMAELKGRGSSSPIRWRIMGTGS